MLTTKTKCIHCGSPSHALFTHDSTTYICGSKINWRTKQLTLSKHCLQNPIVIFDEEFKNISPEILPRDIIHNLNKRLINLDVDFSFTNITHTPSLSNRFYISNDMLYKNYLSFGDIKIDAATLSEVLAYEFLIEVERKLIFQINHSSKRIEQHIDRAKECFEEFIFAPHNKIIISNSLADQLDCNIIKSDINGFVAKSICTIMGISYDVYVDLISTYDYISMLTTPIDVKLSNIISHKFVSNDVDKFYLHCDLDVFNINGSHIQFNNKGK